MSGQQESNPGRKSGSEFYRQKFDCRLVGHGFLYVNCGGSRRQDRQEALVCKTLLKPTARQQGGESND